MDDIERAVEAHVDGFIKIKRQHTADHSCEDLLDLALEKNKDIDFKYGSLWCCPICQTRYRFGRQLAMFDLYKSEMVLGAPTWKRLRWYHRKPKI